MPAIDITDAIPISIPKISINSITSFGVAVLIIILVAGVLGLLTWYMINYLKNNKKVVLFKLIGNVPTMVAAYKARSDRIGNAGDYLFYIPKIKKVLPDPDMQMGRNTYWYWIREDGEWVNFTLDNVDQQMKKAGAKFVHTDMRLQRLGIQKNLQERLNKQSFWQKYGNQIITILYVVILMVCLIVLFKKMEGVWDAGASAGAQVEKMAISVKGVADAIAGLNANCNSGVIPATIPTGGG